jgi:hypothetical protein
MDLTGKVERLGMLDTGNMMSGPVDCIVPTFNDRGYSPMRNFTF